MYALDHLCRLRVVPRGASVAGLPAPAAPHVVQARFDGQAAEALGVAVPAGALCTRAPPLAQRQFQLLQLQLVELF